MTALERLIKLASTDASSLYRETATKASCEYAALVVALKFYADGNHFSEHDDWNCAKMGELPPPPELLDRGDVARDALEQTGCIAADNVAQ